MHQWISGYSEPTRACSNICNLPLYLKHTFEIFQSFWSLTLIWGLSLSLSNNLQVDSEINKSMAFLVLSKDGATLRRKTFRISRVRPLAPAASLVF